MAEFTYADLRIVDRWLKDRIASLRNYRLSDNETWRYRTVITYEIWTLEACRKLLKAQLDALQEYETHAAVEKQEGRS